MIIDFHSHIIPDIDDGAKDIETAVKMLSLSQTQGVDIVVATPHFYIFDKTVNLAVINRDNSFSKLMDSIEASSIKVPTIRRGFEVRNDPLLPTLDDLSSLCIENTRTMLIEMPTSGWTDALYENIEFLLDCGIKVVFAHIERYFDKIPPEVIGKFLDLGVYTQVSAATFLSRSATNIVIELLVNDMLHVIGSDAHNLVSRCSFMDIAYKIVETKLGQRYVDKINETALELLNIQI